MIVKLKAKVTERNRPKGVDEDKKLTKVQIYARNELRYWKKDNNNVT